MVALAGEVSRDRRRVWLLVVAMATTGFEYRKGATRVLEERGRVAMEDGREFRVLDVDVDGLPYRTVRLYGTRGNFVKQLMIGPEYVEAVARALLGKDQ